MFRNRGEVRKSIFVIGIILLFAVFVIGATPLSVPFTSQVPPGTWQETKNCGQTSALMVFCYYNSTIPDEQGIKSIDDWLYIKYGDPINNYNGSDADTTKIEALAKEYGGFPNSYKATSWDITRLKQEIDNGHPIIVAIIASYLSNRGYAWAGGHFVVVKGYDEGDIICNDPGTGSGESKYYLNEEFANALAAQNGSVVVVQPSIACDGGPVEPSNPYELVFNTSGAVATHADQEIPAYTCMIHGDSWTTVTIGFLSSDGVAVFDFPCGFNYDSRYDIIVVPDVRPEWVGIYTPTPLAIHVTGDFYFDGRVQIAGDDIDTNTQDLTYARSGGFPGPKHNQEPSVFVNPPQPPLADYWTKYIFPENSPTRFGVYTSGSEHDIYVPTALAQSTFGPGVPVNPPYKGGGGGGAGGVGGDSGRGYWSGVFSGGPSYGDKEVPVPFGGSGGGWGGNTSPGGAAGGGGIEIVATGNVVLDVNSQIIANGGGQLCSSVSYPAGGGGGGSVRIIAGGSVTNKGIINVNGGKGGDGNAKVKDTGGGGGGGRVAIFYGTTYSNTGTITANGGARGVTYNDPNYPGLPVGLAQSGQDGTIFVTNGTLKKASAPTPANGDEMVYCNPDPCTIQLKWNSGYGGTTDVVYCDTNPTPNTSWGSVPATRGQHSVNMTVFAGNTYYMKVVTDGSVSSDTWSFTTVSWRCMQQYDGNNPNPVSGPEWDFNHDCVVDFKDIEFVVKDWLNPEFGTNMPDLVYFARFANEWLQCFNRTDGCASW